MAHASNPTDAGTTVDAVIVGAGLAGLTAARELVRGGLSCVVLEARDRVGGRTLSQPLGGATIDTGGQWIGPTQHRLAELAKELNVATFPQYHTGRKLLSWGGKLSSYEADLPKFSIFAQLDLLRMDRRLKRFVQEIPPDAPCAPPRRRVGRHDRRDLETAAHAHRGRSIVPRRGDPRRADLRTSRRVVFVLPQLLALGPRPGRIDLHPEGRTARSLFGRRNNYRKSWPSRLHRSWF